MQSISFINLYVKNIGKSLEFYKAILELDPVAQQPGFAMFVLPGGLKLGLWQTATVEPEAEVTGGGGEYCIALPDADSLDSHFAAAREAGLHVTQSPTQMSFGLTYVVEDPDRHRIRYYVPAAA